MVAKYEPCSICEEYIEGVACTKDQCPVAKMKAENERLEKRLEEEKHALFEQQAYTAKLQAEIERLYKSLNLPAQEQYTNGRNDGIKEFEEKLKEKAFYVQESEWDGYVVNCNDIIEFAKEMTEGEDGNV